jgi:hypothetical protein
MPLTVRYTGTWFRADVALYALLSCLIAAAFWYAAQPFLRSPHIAASGAVLIPGFLLLLVAFLVFSTARLVITIVRFRLQIDPNTVIYRGPVRESRYPHTEIDVLRWDPGMATGRNSKPSYLLFKDREGDVLFRVLGSLLSRAQLEEISRVMHKPILDLPTDDKSGERYRSG